MLAPLLSVGTVQHEAMLEGFSSICDIQMYWWSYKEKIAKSSSGGNDAGLAEALPKLFALVFEYQARVICHLSKNQLSRAWEKALGSSDWTSLQSLAMASHGTCKEYVTRGHNEDVETHMTLQLEQMKRSCQNEEKILHALQESHKETWERGLLHDLASAAPTYERDKNFNGDRVEGTCEWFFKDSTFCDWRDNQSSSLIWISAGPGCGKSVLSRALIDERHLHNINVVEITDSNVISQSASTICYFFFKDHDALRTNATNALCAILHQLFCRQSGKVLMRHAESSHRKYGSSLTTNFSELWRILMACAESPEIDDLVCVLDAVDECSETSRKELFEHLRRFCKEKRDPGPSKIKFLLTGRPYDDLEFELRPLENHGAYIRYDGDDKFEEIGRDIDLVIDAKVDSLGHYITYEDHRNQIRRRLKSMEHRTYLWLHLTWDIITKHPSRYGRLSDIEPLLSDIPSAVEEAYEKILDRSTNRKMAEVLLQLVLAATRPLTVEEVNYALTLATTEDELLTHEELSTKIWRSDFKSVVKNLCGLFINVYDFKLYFIHQTAREFLTAPDTETLSKGRMGCFNKKIAQTFASRCCLRYLRLSDLPSLEELGPYYSERTTILLSYPLLKYAMGNWLLHFDSQSDIAKEKDLGHAETLFRSVSSSPGLWFLAASPYISFRREINRPNLLLSINRFFKFKWTKLVVASYFGMHEAVRHMLAAGNQINNVSYEDKVAALLLASLVGHLEVVEVLLSYNADANGRDLNGVTALHKAVFGRLRDLVGLDLSCGEARRKSPAEIVNVLLSHRADAQNYTGLYKTPLAYAAREGSAEIVEILLPITCVGDLSLTFLSLALQKALVLDSMKVLDLLLCFLEKLDRSEEYHQTMLVWAAKVASPNAISCLLRKWRNRISVTEQVLMAAATENIRPETVKILLDECESNRLISTHMNKSPVLECNSQATQVFLDRLDTRHIDTEAILAAAVKQGRLENVTIIMDKYPYDIQKVTEAAMSGSDGERIVKLLLQKHGDAITVTDSMLLAAAENKWYNATLLQLIYQSHGNSINRIVITEKMLEVAAASPHAYQHFKILVHDFNGWDAATEKVLKVVAGGHSYEPNILFRYVFDNCRGNVNITEPILQTAAANWWHGQHILEMLVENYRDKITITAAVLQAAAANKRRGDEIFEILVENYRDKITITEAVLQAAAQNGQRGPAIFNLLIQNYGYRLAVTEAVVKAAATCGQEEILSLLHKANYQGCDIKEWHDINKFWIAMKRGDLPTMKQLLSEGQDLEETNARGETLLTFAVALNNRRVVKLLAQTPGIDVNLADRNGQTPLHAAIRNSTGESIIPILLEAGANPLLLGEDFIHADLPWLSVT